MITPGCGAVGKSKRGGKLYTWNATAYNNNNISGSLGSGYELQTLIISSYAGVHIAQM